MRQTVFICFLALQVLFCMQSLRFLPELGIVPPLPSEKEVAALSFGDNQLYFRSLALNLQMSGDTFGRSTPLKDYDYPELLKWFLLLDTLDDQSFYIPSTAAYYFSRSQHTPDVKYVVDYLESRTFKDPDHNWWWLSQAIYLTNSVLKDKPRALKQAQVLKGVKAEMPAWAHQWEAFIHEDMGEKEEATEVMCQSFDTLRNADQLSERELDFMIYYFKDRMGIKESDSEDEVSAKLAKIAEICYDRREAKSRKEATRRRP